MDLRLKTKGLFLSGVFTIIAGFSLFVFNNSQALAAGFKNCTKTSTNAFQACKHEVKDDYFIAAGNCNNMSDPGDREECRDEAVDERQEAEEVCQDQYDARLEICEELGEAAYEPDLDPEDFVDPDDIGETVAVNQYWPLVPGTIWVYVGETDEGTETITVTVTDDTKEIEYPEESGLIFSCRVVRDVAELDGEVIEDTYDWYAQDMAGNVWYFGETSKQFEDGELVDLEGSWKAGKDSAKPGIVMWANPQEGDFYRQEFYLGDAEDMAEVVSRGEESVTVPFGTFTDGVLKTREWTPIEPDGLEFKCYAPGIGVVLEVNPDTGDRVELVDMTTP